MLQLPVRSTAPSFCCKSGTIASLWGIVTLHPLMSSQSSSLKKAGSSPLGTRNGTITLFRPSWRNAALWTAGAQALLDRVADDAVDLGIGVDLVDKQVVSQHAVDGASRRRRPARD